MTQFLTFYDSIKCELYHGFKSPAIISKAHFLAKRGIVSDGKIAPKLGGEVYFVISRGKGLACFFAFYKEIGRTHYLKATLW